jgi:hypothetical protein
MTHQAWQGYTVTFVEVSALTFLMHAAHKAASPVFQVYFLSGSWHSCTQPPLVRKFLESAMQVLQAVTLRALALRGNHHATEELDLEDKERWVNDQCRP